MQYWMIVLIGYIVFRLLPIKKSADCYKDVLPAVVLLCISGFGILAFNGYDRTGMILGASIALILLLQFYAATKFFPEIDKDLLLIINTLTVIGLIMLQRLSPVAAILQAQWLVAGSILMFIFTALAKYLLEQSKKYVCLLMLLSLLLLAAPLVIGVELGGAKSFIGIWGHTVQTSEFVRLFFLMILAVNFTSCKSRIERFWTFAFVAAAMGILVAQRDLGMTFLYFSVFLVLYLVATSDWLLGVPAILAAVCGAVISYYSFAHVRVRVFAWINPWLDAEGRGYQIIQAINAMERGGLTGLGLGMGTPYNIPVVQTDFIFAALVEEMGWVVGILVVIMYFFIMRKGVAAVLTDIAFEYKILGFGAAFFVFLQAMVIIGGVTRFIPLTGVTLPFVSYGGSSMLSSYSMMGILQAAIMSGKTNRQAK